MRSYTYPELCVEVVSPSNSKQDTQEKAGLYLRAGAEDVWIVWEHGEIEYHGKTGKLTQSALGIEPNIPGLLKSI